MKMDGQRVVCECEHAAHFNDGAEKTPHGNPGHKYGIAFDAAQVESVATPHGPFVVCKDCANDCYRKFLPLWRWAPTDARREINNILDRFSIVEHRAANAMSMTKEGQYAQEAHDIRETLIRWILREAN